MWRSIVMMKHDVTNCLSSAHFLEARKNFWQNIIGIEAPRNGGTFRHHYSSHNAFGGEENASAEKKMQNMHFLLFFAVLAI